MLFKLYKHISEEIHKYIAVGISRNIAEGNSRLMNYFHCYCVLNFPIGIIKENLKDVARDTHKEFADGIDKRVPKVIFGKKLNHP